MNTPNSLKANPFKVPERYFENFEQQIFAKLEQQKKHRNIRLIWISGSAAAAVIIGFLLLNTVKPPVNYLSRNEIEVYFENHPSPFDDEIIYDNLYTKPSVSEDQQKQEAIYNYLMEDNNTNDLFLE